MTFRRLLDPLTLLIVLAGISAYVGTAMLFFDAVQKMANPRPLIYFLLVSAGVLGALFVGRWIHRRRNPDGEGWVILALHSIGSPDGPLYWSNTFGWASLDCAHVYPANTPGRVNLPMGGMWERRENAAARASVPKPDTPSTLYLRLFHGRNAKDEQLNDWGFEGPVFAIQYLHSVYLTTFNIGVPQGRYREDDYDTDLHIEDGLIYYDGKWYGDCSVFAGPLPDDYRASLTKWDSTLAEPPRKETLR